MGKSFYETYKDIIRQRALELHEIFKNVPPMEAVKSLYKMVDDEISKIDKSNMSCKKGCYFCCHDEVVMSEMEASYFLEKIDGVEVDEKVLSLQNSVNDFTKLKWADMKCPLLDKNGECKVYENRPLICRTINSIDDPQLCKEKKLHPQLYRIEIASIQMVLIMLSNMKNVSLHNLIVK